MFYTAYGESVRSKVSLDRFGLKRTQKPSSNVINLDFIHHTNELSNNYLNHQTKVNSSFGYYLNKEIALFEVYSGKKIVIKHFNDIDNDLIHTLLNYPFGILFNQRKQYVIHASAVIFNDKVFCFCGKTQSGKSSLASYLINMGGYLISEDTCVFDYKSKNLVLLPSYNFLKISDDVNEYMKEPFSKPIRFFKKSTQRKGYILNDKKFYRRPAAVDYFIYLEWSDHTPNLEKLNNKDSLKMLLSNEFISFSKENASYRFKAALDLVKQAKHFKYCRKKELHTLDEFINLF